MIDAQEIEDRGQQLAIHSSNVQRDYLFGWLLYYLFVHGRFRDELFLKGGNGLRKAYFLETRFSGDLDFGTAHDIDMELLKQEITGACAYIQEHAGITFELDRNDVKEKFGKWKEDRWKVFEVRIYFRDFYGEESKIVLRISLDVTRFDRAYLPIQTRPLLHPYSDAEEIACNIRCMQLEEILATKLKCLLQRDYAPDLFDFIYSLYLNDQIPIDKRAVRSVFLQRTIFERSPGMARKILLKLPFEMLRAKWTKTIVCGEGLLMDCEDAISKFVTQVNEIFEGAAEASYYDKLFFEPDARNAILRAGKSMTLLRIVYNGADRLIEPYALKFQQRRDGVAKEYFYVYDRTGSSLNPGWKTFVAENVQSISNTEETFEPQYEIELSKAGDIPEDRLLYDPAKQRQPRRGMPGTSRGWGSVPRRVSSLDPKHVFRCSTCGKLFYKKSYDSSLGEHKNKRGYLCYGYGVFVRTTYP